jgi:SAM-dependent methyltransferase
MPYCKLFRHENLAAVQAQLEQPPFAAQSFDGLLVVTSLMYVNRLEIKQALDSLARLLKPGGLALFLDPGREIQRLLEVLSWSRRTSPTGGIGFFAKEYRNLISSSGFDICTSGGNPAFTLGVTVLGLTKASTAWQLACLRRMTAFDCREIGFGGYALHRWLVAIRS